ncbi:MAG: hypothetical protein M3Y66_06085, partial [Actinomycetota bacterium]|nr:hypothetical protein [Actinomycetota bacterium]
SVLRVTFARALIGMTATMVLWSVAPAALGWTPEVIMSGSMSPILGVGDVVVTRPVGSAHISVGNIITVDDPDHPGRTRTHRVAGYASNGQLRLRGDANHRADSTLIDRRSVRGLGVLRVPYVGAPLVWIRDGDWLKLTACLLLLTWCLLNLTLRPSRERRPRQGGPSASRKGLVGATVALTVASVVTSGGAADAAFLTKAVNSNNSLAAAADFYAYRTAVLADAPLMYWRLSEASGTIAADASVNGRVGTYAGTYTLGQPSALTETRNTSVSFTAAALTANTSTTAPTTFSVEAWVKTGTTAGGRIIGFGNNGGVTASTTTDRQLYLAPSGKVVFGLGSTKTAVTSPGVVNDNTWHQVVGTYSAATGMRLYVDGQQVATGSATPVSMTGYWRAGAESLSGWPTPPTGSYLAGTLDEVSTFSVALSAARVLAHYTAATT